MTYYTVALGRFKASHRRRYVDDTEEAVRKNLMVQHSRFVNSGNRQGATFNMEVLLPTLVLICCTRYYPAIISVTKHNALVLGVVWASVSFARVRAMKMLMTRMKMMRMRGFRRCPRCSRR